MNSEDNKIKAILVLDVIGKPPEHLVEILGKVIEEMEGEKGVEVISKKIKEPIPMKGRKDFYTTFAEVEVDVEDIAYLSGLMFKYMPANIEVISPEIMAIANNKIGDLMNNLVIKLHGYDELAKVMQVEKRILFNKIKELGGEVPSQVRPPAKIYQPGDEKKAPVQKKQRKKSSEKGKKKKSKKSGSKKTKSKKKKAKKTKKKSKKSGKKKKK